VNNNILFITYWSFNDPLIQTYTLPYIQIIRKITKGTLYLATYEHDNSIDCIQQEKIKKKLEAEGIQWISYSYSRFGLYAFVNIISSIILLLRLSISKKIDTIHCWCTPAGSIGYIISALAGKKLIIDSYEPHAESMIENRVWKKDSFAYKFLFFLEKMQAKHAQTIIGTTESIKEYVFSKHNIKLDKFYAKPACVDLNLFSFQKKKKLELINKYDLNNTIVCVYAGKFGGIYLEKEVFDFFQTAYDYWQGKFRVILCTSHSIHEIKKYCQASKLNEDAITKIYVPHNEIADYIGLGDFAITPVKAIPSKRYCSPIKDGEYWALGLPVVVPPNISDDSEIIEQHNIGSIWKYWDKDGHLKSIQKINQLLTTYSTDEIYKKIRLVAETYRNFSVAEKIYKDIYK